MISDPQGQQHSSKRFSNNNGEPYAHLLLNLSPFTFHFSLTMASHADAEASKAARRYFSRRGIDVGMADIRVMHGVCHIRGVVSFVRGAEGEQDLKTAVQQAAMILRRRPDIRDVAIDLIYRETES